MHLKPSFTIDSAMKNWNISDNSMIIIALLAQVSLIIRNTLRRYTKRKHSKKLLLLLLLLHLLGEKITIIAARYNITMLACRIPWNWTKSDNTICKCCKRKPKKQLLKWNAKHNMMLKQQNVHFHLKSFRSIILVPHAKWQLRK